MFCNVGFIGTGVMASETAEKIKHVEGLVKYAVASRNIDRAKAFAYEHGFEKYYGSYEELVSDSKVDLIYIATPQAFHYEQMKLCIQMGKNVLCEKPFTLNRTQATEILALAKQKNVFVSEALWCRYIPMAAKIQSFLKSGIIGDIQHVNVQLCYNVWSKERIRSLKTGGGALLECGIYGINFISLVFGPNVKKVIAHAVFDPDEKTDIYETVFLDYENGHDAVLFCTAQNTGSRTAMIYGSNGYAVIDHVNVYDRLSVYDNKHNLLYSESTDPDCCGVCCEFIEAMNCINHGKIQSQASSFDMIFSVMGTLDKIRDVICMKYPSEKTK